MDGHLVHVNDLLPFPEAMGTAVYV